MTPAYQAVAASVDYIAVAVEALLSHAAGVGGVLRNQKLHVSADTCELLIATRAAPHASRAMQMASASSALSPCRRARRTRSSRTPSGERFFARRQWRESNRRLSPSQLRHVQPDA